MNKKLSMIGFYCNLFFLSSMLYSSAGHIASIRYSVQSAYQLLLNISVAGATRQVANAVALQSTGKAVVASSYKTSSLFKINVQRFATDFSLDTSFGSDGVLPISIAGGTNDFPQALAVDSADRIMVAGIQQETSYFLACVKADGSGLDTLFGTNGITAFTIAGGAVAHITSCVVATDGKILVGGYYGSSSSKGFVARFTLNGQLDSSFNESTIGAADGSGYVTFHPDSNVFAVSSIAVTGENNDIIVAGYHRLSSKYHVYIVKLLGVNDGASAVAGSYDVTFGSNGIVEGLPAGSDHQLVYAVVVDGTGRIIVGGYYGFDMPACFVSCYTSSGSLDTSFHESSLGAADGGNITFFVRGYDDEILAMQLDSDDNILCGGYTADADFNYDNFVARITPQGELDTTFHTTGISVFSFAGNHADNIKAIAVQNDNRIVVVGFDYSIRSNEKAYIARLKADGLIDTDPEVIASSSGILGEFPADRILYTALCSVGSDKFCMISDVNDTSSLMAQIVGDNILDISFNATGKVVLVQKQPTAIIQGAAEKIIVCGQDDGSGNGWVRRYTSSGTVDTTFNETGLLVDADLVTVHGLLCLPDGSIVTMLEDALQAYLPNGSSVRWSFIKAGYVIDDMVLDATGSIFVVTRQVSGGNALTINKIDALSGTELSFAGNIGGIKGVHNLSSAVYNKARLALDANGFLVVALQKTDGSGIDIQRYASDAGEDTPLESVSLTAITNMQLVRLQGTQSGQMVLAGYTSDAYVVIRLAAEGLSLDTTFNATGMQTFTVSADQTSRLLTDLMLLADGTLVIVGSGIINTTRRQSWITRIVGDSGIAQTARFALAFSIPESVRMLQRLPHFLFSKEKKALGVIRWFHGWNQWRKYRKN